MRALAVVTIVAALAWTVEARSPGAAKVAPRSASESEPETSASISLPPNRRAGKSIEAAVDLIHDGNYLDAVGALQNLLELPEDAFIKVASDESGPAHWSSVRAEAKRMLGALPPKGRDVYELQFGARAREQLATAKKEGDTRKLAAIAQRFPHTQAASEALALLGSYHLSRGRPELAAICFERLLNSKASMTPVVLLKAAMAFHQSGNAELAARAWTQLGARAPRGLTLGDRTVSLEDLRHELDRLPGPNRDARANEWLAFRGAADRSAAGEGSIPFLDDDLDRWSHATVHEVQAKQWLSQAIEEQERRRQGPILPAFFPLIAQGKLVFRTHGGIRAVDLKNGKQAWNVSSDLSLDHLSGAIERRGPVTQWIQAYFQGGNYSVLFENSALGTLSADHARVYAIDDLALLPHPLFLQQTPWRGGNPAMLGSFEADYHRSALKAYDLATGQLRWQRGGKDVKDGEETFFLGPPLPLGGKLYALAEIKGVLKLLCLNPETGEDRWTQTLADVRDPLPTDVGRRSQAAPLAYGDGILVCPTNAGGVLGIDLLTHSLVWAYLYRERAPAATAPANLWEGRRLARPHRLAMPDWKNSAPIVRGGKVVFTAPDGTSVHCLNVRDGSLVWKADRGNDLYLAGVFNQKVLLVGKQTCRALDLDNGKPLWCIETGTPSGMGVASGSLYYLPLKAPARQTEPSPEICAIDMNKGEIVARARSTKREIPGNLLFTDGMVISQTASAVTAYPQLATKLAKVDAALKANPHDAAGLASRGELRGNRGDLPGAVEDLRLALAQKPVDALRSRIREKLYATLTELLGRDFAAAEKYLEEYRELCTVTAVSGSSVKEQEDAAAESRRRSASYLCLVAKGRERQGRLQAAFRAYHDFAAAAVSDELMAVPGDPSRKVRPDRWARGRAAALLAGASAEQRGVLEGEVTREAKEALAGAGPDRLRRFAGLYGSLLHSGQQARIELARRLAADPKAGVSRALEAELLLLRVRAEAEPEVAARATYELARLLLERGDVAGAVAWYRVLGRDFATTTVVDDKTGAELLDGLASDKRFFEHLGPARSAWPAGPWKATESVGVNSARPPQLAFTPEGVVPPFFAKHELVLNLTNFQLQLLGESGNEIWNQQIIRGNVRVHFFNNRALRLPATLAGHLAVVNVGGMVYAVDPLGKRLAWEKDLLPGVGVLGTPYQVLPSVEGGFEAYYPDGRVQKVAAPGPVTASYVALRTLNQLVALDPFDGKTLWTREDVPADAPLFGDETHLYYVESKPDGSKVGRALRACDGARVEVADFAMLFEAKFRTFGRCLLLAHDDGSRLTLRLHDVHTGKDRWQKAFANGARLATTEDAQLVGVIEPKEGRVSVLDPASGSVQLAAKVAPAAFDKAGYIRLVADDEQVYVAVQRPADAAAVGAGPWPNATGMNSVPINGKLIALRKSDGKLAWQADVANQCLVLDAFRDLPVVVCSARMLKWAPGGRGQIPFTKTLCFDKRSGKLIYEKEQDHGTPFHTLKIDRKTHRIELASYNVKVEIRPGE